jgi:hypothetical protein
MSVIYVCAVEHTRDGSAPMTYRTLPPPERLCPELAASLEPDKGQRWRFIRHPYVNSTYDAEVSAINTLYNRKYHAASDAAASAKADRRWYEYLFYHESPWRRGAFTAIEAELTHPEYWELLGNVWTQCDAPFQERPHWVRLWRSPRPGREFSMEQGER